MTVRSRAARLLLTGTLLGSLLIGASCRRQEIPKEPAPEAPPKPRVLAVPCCVWLSLLLNANELWVARRLGVPVRLTQLPGLMRRTTAPFKRRVFALLAQTLRRGDASPE